MAVFESAWLRSSDKAPTAVLKLPVETLNNENVPTAVFATPAVRLLRALSPSAVVKLGYPPSGGGTTACACVNSARQARVIKNKRGAGITEISVFMLLL